MSNNIYDADATFDRFDVVEAHWLYYSQWHNGGGSTEYQRLSKILAYFKPGPHLDYDYLSENGKLIYLQLVTNHQVQEQHKVLVHTALDMADYRGHLMEPVQFSHKFYQFSCTFCNACLVAKLDDNSIRGKAAGPQLCNNSQEV